MKDKDNNSPQNLGYPLGYLFSLYSFLAIFSFQFLIWKLGIIGFLIGVTLRLSIFIIDYYTSNATIYNLSILEKNGYDTKIFLNKIFKSLIFRLIILGFIYNYLSKDIEVHYDIKLLMHVVVSLILTEIYFITTHKHMHKFHPDLHRLHHCCLRPSYTTNIFFDKLDLFLEIFVPLIIAFIYTYAINKDYFAFSVSNGLITAWYFMDHDEYLRLPHWYHHRYINSHYGAYIKGGTFEENDKIKESIIR